VAFDGIVLVLCGITYKVALLRNSSCKRFLILEELAIPKFCYLLIIIIVIVIIIIAIHPNHGKSVTMATGV
jgi:hypothetical protein